MTSVRCVVGVVSDTDTTELATTVRSIVAAAEPGDDLVLLAERRDLAALAHITALLSGGLDPVRAHVVRVEDLTGPGVLAAVTEVGHTSAPDVTSLLTPGTALCLGALRRIRQVFGDHPAVDLAYGDSVTKSPLGDVAILRSGWAPDQLRSAFTLGPVVAVRTSLLADLNPTSAHDLTLMVSERARSIAHIPDILSTVDADHHEIGRQVDPDAVSRHIERLGLPMLASASTDVDVGLTPLTGAELETSVSVVILTGGATREVGGHNMLLVANAVASVLISTPDDDEVEIVVVIDRTTPSELGEQLRALDPDRIRIVRDTEPFNFSAANNLGVRSCKGDVVVFLNDDAEVRTPDWLDRIRMHLAVPGVGIVGARLLFGNGLVQHAGLVIRNGWVEHRFGGYPDNDRTRPSGIENVTAVTGACFAMNRSLFEELQGFPEDFPLNFNDVDLCLSVRQAGHRVVLDHDLVLLHHETSSRHAGIADDEQRRFVEKWIEGDPIDPFDHPHFAAVRAEPIAPPAALLRLRQALRSSDEPPRISPAGMAPR